MTYDGHSGYDASVAATYDLDRQDEEHWSAEQQFVRTFADAHTLGRVLDVPVGTGRFLGELSGAAGIVGLDVSEDMLAKAREAQGALDLANVRLVVGDALATGFADREFDTVLCFRLVHLLPPDLVTLLLCELARVCKVRVLLQVYATPAQVRPPMAKRLLRRMRRWFQRTPTPPTTPWSHIESFSHSSPFLDACSAAAGLVLVQRHWLSNYHGTSVEVLELRPT